MNTGQRPIWIGTLGALAACAPAPSAPPEPPETAVVDPEMSHPVDPRAPTEPCARPLAVLEVGAGSDEYGEPLVGTVQAEAVAIRNSWSFTISALVRAPPQPLSTSGLAGQGPAIGIQAVAALTDAGIELVGDPLGPTLYLYPISWDPDTCTGVVTGRFVLGGAPGREPWLDTLCAHVGEEVEVQLVASFPFEPGSTVSATASGPLSIVTPYDGCDVE